MFLKDANKAIERNPTLPVRRVFDEAARQVAGNEIPDFRNVQSRMKRLRRSFLPPIPRDINDVTIQDEWARTWAGRSFLSHIDNNWGICVFTTKKLLKALQTSECIYLDGTFRTAPLPYQQFVSIHGRYHGYVVPLVFCLMTGKTVGQYRQVLQHVKAKVRRFTGHNLRPQKIVIDFEASLIISLERNSLDLDCQGAIFISLKASGSQYTNWD